MCRSNPQLILLNHLCCLTSLAPELDPSRRCSSLINSLRMADLQKLTGELEAQMQHCRRCSSPGDWSGIREGYFVLEHIGEGGIPVWALERSSGELRVS